MAAVLNFLILVFWIVLMIVIYTLMTTVRVVVEALPYATGVIGSLILTLLYPPIKDLIPGHPSLSVFSFIALVELLIFLLLRFRQTSRPTIIFTSSLMINFVDSLVFYSMKVDSWQLGIFCTIAYLVSTAIILKSNCISQEMERVKNRNIILSIFAGILYAMSVGVSLLTILGGIWEPYIKTFGNEVFYQRYDTISIYVIIAAMVITVIISVVKNMFIDTLFQVEYDEVS